MVRVQYLPDKLLARIPQSFWANPASSPFPMGSARVLPELRFPGDKVIEFDEDLLCDVFKEGIERHGEKHNELDSWLAPRVHSLIRVPRRVSADRLFWA